MGTAISLLLPALSILVGQSVLVTLDTTRRYLDGITARSRHHARVRADGGTRGQAVSCRGVGLALVALAVLLAGCATPRDPYAVPPASDQLSRDDDAGRCLRLLRANDARIREAGLGDALAARVPGYPFLRADRFTVHWNPGGGGADNGNMATLHGGRLDRMARIDAEARAVEMTNAAIPASESGALARCHELLAAEARASAARAVAAARVPDSYDDALRLLGLYPLTRVPFSWGVAAWQRTTRELFATRLAEVPVLGRRVAYAPATAVPQGPVAGLLPATEAAALRMPDLAPGRAWQLLQAHAPVLVVDTLDDDDRVGALRWQAGDGHPAVTVDPGEPTAYARVAWAVVDGAATLQLVYTFWFPARPASRPLDLLAGRLDALVWRVTLDAEGRALVYDSIHACGCYHMFFPTGRVRERPGPRPDEGVFDETMFSPQAVRSPGPGERVTIFVGARDHYIQRVVVDAPSPVTGATPATGATGVTYHLRDEDRLRTLPLPAAAGSGTRSVYGPDGLVPGSERAERFFFWPMGVRSAGQMRQWGHHATAFVGRRHFDDPGLIERDFSIVSGSD